MVSMERIKKKPKNMNTAGLAIFAKTKGLSPVKTRLAASIGKPLAEAFYSLSVRAVAEIADTASKEHNNAIVPYWALAEKEAPNHSEWQNFQTTWTGEGGLGERLHTIYNRLLKKHDTVILMGTDSPQLEPNLIIEAMSMLRNQSASCMIGPASDGGFYLFAAKVAIKEQTWTQVCYSQSTTLEELAAHLSSEGITAKMLPRKSDVDTIDDLKLLFNTLTLSNTLLPAQKKLYDWLKTQSALLDLK